MSPWDKRMIPATVLAFLGIGSMFLASAYGPRFMWVPFVFLIPCAVLTLSARRLP